MRRLERQRDKGTRMSPYLLNLFNMIQKEKIIDLISDYLNKESLFLVDTQISKDNDITITIESLETITIKNCADVSKIVEEGLDREKEDFSLTVTSAGLNMPFKVLKQYEKFLNKEVEILLIKGVKLIATLKKVSIDQIEVSRFIMEKKEGKKRAQKTEITETYNLSDVKSTRPFIKFK